MDRAEETVQAVPAQTRPPVDERFEETAGNARHECEPEREREQTAGTEPKGMSTFQ